MRNLICWCPQTHKPIDLQLFTDYATLARIWSSSVRFHCPQWGGDKKTGGPPFASNPLYLEPNGAKRTRHQNRPWLRKACIFRGNDFRGLCLNMRRIELARSQSPLGNDQQQQPPQTLRKADHAKAARYQCDHHRVVSQGDHFCEQQKPKAQSTAAKC